MNRLDAADLIFPSESASFQSAFPTFRAAEANQETLFAAIGVIRIPPLMCKPTEQLYVSHKKSLKVAPNASAG